MDMCDVALAAAVPLPTSGEELPSEYDAIFAEIMNDDIVECHPYATPLQCRTNTSAVEKRVEKLKRNIQALREASEKVVNKRLRKCQNAACGHLCGSRAQVCKVCQTPMKREFSENTRSVRRCRAKKRLKLGKPRFVKKLTCSKKKSTKRLRKCLNCQSFMGPNAKSCKSCGTPAPPRLAKSVVRAVNRKKRRIIRSIPALV